MQDGQTPRVDKHGQLPSRWLRWTGWLLTALFVIFMLAASIAPKLLHIKVATDTLVSLGWPSDAAVMIGLLELACVLLYLWPRTSLLGAVLATGLLGGAIATQMRVGAPLFSHTLFGLYLGIMMWGGLWLRSAVLRSVLPWTPAKTSNR